MAYLALYGGIGTPRGDYSGKTEQVIVEVTDQPTGGWLFLSTYESELQRRRKRKEEVEEDLEQITDSVDREIAEILRPELERDAELQRLRELAIKDANKRAAKQYSERVSKAFTRAINQGNRSAMEALDRELKRAQEEEEFLVTAVMMLLDD